MNAASQLHPRTRRSKKRRQNDSAVSASSQRSGHRSTKRSPNDKSYSELDMLAGKISGFY